MKCVKRLVPGPSETKVASIIEDLRSAPALAPFAPEAKAFCAALSRALFTDPRFRTMPDMQALAFRLRPAELQRFEDSYRASLPAPPALVQPRGLVFHIAPANV